MPEEEAHPTDRVQLAYMAQGDKDATGQSSSRETFTHSNSVSSVFHQVTWEGNLECKQKEDD